MTKTPEIPESLYPAAYDYIHNYKGKFYICPCSEVVLQNNRYCPNCGQKLYIPKIPNVRTITTITRNAVKSKLKKRGDKK